jgi:hypothetical protein
MADEELAEELTEDVDKKLPVQLLQESSEVEDFMDAAEDFAAVLSSDFAEMDIDDLPIDPQLM